MLVASIRKVVAQLPGSGESHGLRDHVTHQGSGAVLGDVTAYTLRRGMAFLGVHTSERL